jgi:hypothetical protein
MAFHNPLSPPARGRDAIRKKAMDQFAAPRGASHTVQHELSLERDAVDANTAKLKALRLVKEEADREAAALAAANAPPPKAKKPRTKFILG